MLAFPLKIGSRQVVRGIAVYLTGSLINPLRNEWVLYAGLIGCALALPLALMCGPLRGILCYCRLIDCFFGVVRAFPCYTACT